MAVTAAALLSPVGLITPAMFPGDDGGLIVGPNLTARLTAYLADGVSQMPAGNTLSGGQVDAATIEWAYYRAFWDVYLRIAMLPRTTQLADEGSVSYDKEQAIRFQSEALRHRLLFDTISATADTLVVQPLPTHTLTKSVY